MTRIAGYYDALGLGAVIFAGWSGHWLITPIQHPDASTAQYITIWLQIATGVGVAVWAHRKSQRLKGNPQAPSPS